MSGRAKSRNKSIQRDEFEYSVRSWVGERTVTRSRQAIPRSCGSSFRIAQPTGIGATNRCSMGTISRKVVLTDGGTQKGAQSSS